MRIVSTSYAKTSGFDSPADWLQRINFYTGVLEQLAQKNTVTDIERISYEGEYTHNGVHYQFIRQRKKVVLFPFRMHRHIKRLKPDAVIVHGLIFPLQVIQLRLSLGRSVKIICHHHAEKPYKRWGKIVQRLADRYIDAYLFTSAEFGMQWIKNGNIHDEKKIYEVMEVSSVFTPANKQESRNKLSITSSPVFLWAGRLNENKDPLTVINAFTRFHRQHPSAKLYMIYQEDDLLNEVKQCITNEKAAQGIQLVGKIPHEQMGTWYNSADFILSGSHYEGSGVAVCEAMSCGCIPIVTDIMSFRRMTGGCGFLFEPGNAEALLSLLLQTPHLTIEKERSKVLQQFKEELSFEAIAKKTEAAIAGLTDESG